jgi:hypothetical protein
MVRSLPDAATRFYPFEIRRKTDENISKKSSRRHDATATMPLALKHPRDDVTIDIDNSDDDTRQTWPLTNHKPKKIAMVSLDERPTMPRRPSFVADDAPSVHKYVPEATHNSIGYTCQGFSAGLHPGIIAVFDFAVAHCRSVHQCASRRRPPTVMAATWHLHVPRASARLQGSSATSLTHEFPLVTFVSFITRVAGSQSTSRTILRLGPSRASRTSAACAVRWRTA